VLPAALGADQLHHALCSIRGRVEAKLAQLGQRLRVGCPWLTGLVPTPDIVGRETRQRPEGSEYLRSNTELAEAIIEQPGDDDISIGRLASVPILQVLVSRSSSPSRSSFCGLRTA